MEKAYPYLPALLALASGFLLTGFVVFRARNQETQRLRDAFELHAEFCGQMIRARVEEARATAVHGVDRLCRQQRLFAEGWRDRFQEFAETALVERPALCGIGLRPSGADDAPLVVVAATADQAVRHALRDELQRAVEAPVAHRDKDDAVGARFVDTWTMAGCETIAVYSETRGRPPDGYLAVCYDLGRLFANILPAEHAPCVRIEIVDRGATGPPSGPESGTPPLRADGERALVPTIGSGDGAVSVPLGIGPGRFDVRIAPTERLADTYRADAGWWVLAAGASISLLLARYVASLTSRTAASEIERAHHAAALESANEELSQQLLRQQRAHERVHILTQAIECSPLSVVITDADGIVEYVNQKYLDRTGLRKEGLIGWTAPLLQDGELAPEARGALRKAMVGGREWQLETRGARPSGERLAEHVALAPIRGRDGSSVSHYVFMHTDVTERDRLQQEFLQSQKMEVVGRLAGGVVHDLSNMLTVILGFSQIVQIELGDENPLAEDIEEIIRVGERAAALNRQLLSFARTQSYQAEKIDVNQTLADMDRFLRRTLGEDVVLRTEFADLGGTIEIDPGQFNQMLMNLAVNARDAMPEGGELTVTTAVVDLPLELCQLNQLRPGRFVRLEVRDTGVGMPDHVREHLFEPFFTTKPEGKGTGLGLSTVYGIVRRFHGAIDVMSVLGQGTTFRIYLPLCRAARDDTGGRRQARVPRGTETVLLVEDDIDVRQLCATLLVGLGYQVIEAGRADEAIRIAMEEGDRIELIITDVVMPDLNGLEMVTQLKPLLPNVPVIYTTGFSDHPILARHPGRTDGCLLSKPFSREKLGRTVRNALDHARPVPSSLPIAIT